MISLLSNMNMKGKKMKKTICIVLTAAMLSSLIFTSGALAFLKGDLNGDDEIDNKDVVSLFKYVSDATHAYYESAYDINDDVVIDNKDVVSLFRSQSTIKPTYEPTPKEYFGFDQKSDGTYEIRPADINDLPETLVIPQTYNGMPVTSISDGAFQGCTCIIVIIIIGSVQNIGAHAFDGCVNLKEVVMPKSLQTVGEYAFSGCTELTSVTFSGSVISIGKGAFSDCVNLESASLPNSVTEIGANAFYNCTSLKNVSLGRELKTIGEGAFAYCIIIIIIIIPENVEFIGEDAFAYCSSLKTVVLGGSLTIISDGAFRGCESLQSIDIPDSVTEIGANAFSDCTSLETVTIGSNVVRIGDGAFSGCILIVIIIIPANVRSIGINAFDLCTALTQIIFETLEGWYVEGSPVSVSDLSDPEKAAELVRSVYSGLSWEIRHEHTYGEWEITKEPSCTKAGEKQRTCSVCGETETEAIPALGHDYGEDNICKRCGKEKLEPTPDSNFLFTLLDDDTYEIEAINKYTLPKEIVIPENRHGKPVTKIKRFAFMGFDKLISVIIPDTVTEICDYAFSGCSSLSDVTMPDSVKKIGDYAFNGCESLTSITIPDGVTEINNGTFYQCSNLISVTIPDSVTKIDTKAFYNCMYLMHITYKGTYNQWKNIKKYQNWDEGDIFYTIHCTDGDYKRNGNKL